MQSKKDRAVATLITTAQSNNTLNGSYHHSRCKSNGNLKEQIGGLLLHLQTSLSQDERKKCWHTFDLKLRRYLDLNYLGGAL